MQETISYEDLKHLTDAALEALGLSGTDREIVRDVLLYAELSGNNQGLIKIPQKAVQPSPDATPIVIERPFPAVAHIRETVKSAWWSWIAQSTWLPKLQRYAG